MAVRLRLTRVGGRKNPIWRVVVADQRSKRDGRVIETVGHYNAQTNPSTIVLDEERIKDWLARGAQPTDTVRKLLRIQGICSDRRLAARRRSCSSTWRGGSSTSPTPCASTRSTRTTARSCSSCRSPTDDYGNVIGRGGRTAAALRTVVKTAAVKDRQRVFVDIVDA